MLQLTDLISWGATRECYHHPTDDSHCIKVMQKGKSAETLQQELNIYRKLKQKLGNKVAVGNAVQRIFERPVKL